MAGPDKCWLLGPMYKLLLKDAHYAQYFSVKRIG